MSAELKHKAVIYKGGQCHYCYLTLEESHYSVFDFHHRNPLEKSYDWSKMRKLSWNKIVEELDKCLLLCSNCHRMQHSMVRFV